eukprot:6949293-Pyramimonas_sp.AAC.1
MLILTTTTSDHVLFKDEASAPGREVLLCHPQQRAHSKGPLKNPKKEYSHKNIPTAHASEFSLIRVRHRHVASGKW